MTTVRQNNFPLKQLVKWSLAKFFTRRIIFTDRNKYFYRSIPAYFIKVILTSNSLKGFAFATNKTFPLVQIITTCYISIKINYFIKEKCFYYFGRHVGLLLIFNKYSHLISWNFYIHSIAFYFYTNRISYFTNNIETFN